jgi:hypothetical protein
MNGAVDRLRATPGQSLQSPDERDGRVTFDDEVDVVGLD